MSELIEYLQALNPSALNYSEWVQCGMALKQEGFPVSVWDDWSARDAARYKPGECARKWDTFSGSGNIITGGTIYQMCKDRGLLPDVRDGFLNWDAAFIADGRADHEQADTWKPGREVRRYLETLFKPSDLISIVTKSIQDKDGKYKPCNTGNTFRVSELLDKLSRYGDDIGAAIGDYNPKAGAWVRFNPVDGQGVKNTNVTEYRYALVESDTLSISEQKDLIKKLNLPIAALVHSGGKSLHAIVHIDATDYETYKTRVKELYRICKENGLEIDEQNKNPSRLSRLPGCDRNGNRQRIIEKNTGAESWAAWEKSRNATGKAEKKPPDLIPMSATELNMLDLPPINWIVENILPEGVTLFSGKQKTYKSFMMLDLCIQVCKGSMFMGNRCIQSHALYLDLESGLRRPRDRIRKICEGQQIPEGLYILTALDGVRQIGNGFEEQIRKLLQSDPELKLIVIDVLEKIRPEPENKRSAYSMDYKVINPLNQLVAEFPGIGILLVTHNTKSVDLNDWQNNISGSVGLSGSVDSVWGVTKEKREDLNAVLHVSGREIRAEEFIIKFNENTLRWEYLGTAESQKKEQFKTDYANSMVIQTIKKGFQILGGTYEVTISELVDYSEYWGTAIYGKTNDAIGKEIGRYKNLLEMDGITYKTRRNNKSRVYTFTETTFDLDQAIENLETHIKEKK